MRTSSPRTGCPACSTSEPPTSLYNVLSERYGLVMEWGEDMIEATAASPSTARLLNVEVGSPLLKIQRHAFVARAMVDYSVSYYRADRYKLWVPLQRPGVRPTRNYASGYRPVAGAVPDAALRGWTSRRQQLERRKARSWDRAFLRVTAWWLASG